MMKKNRIKDRAKQAPAYIKREVELSMFTAKRIRARLVERGLNQRELAQLLDVKESLVSRWMTGLHNFTYATIAKIETVLDFKIIPDKPELSFKK